MSKKLIALTVCALAVLSGCTSVITGQAEPAAVPGGSQPSELGDARTVNPCSFISDKAFDGLTPKVKIDVTTVSYGTCDVTVRFLDGSEPPQTKAAWFLHASFKDFLSGPEDYQTRYRVSVSPEQVQGHSVFKGASDDAGCVRGIGLSGNNTVVLAVRPGAGNAGSDPCPVADAAMNTALKLISGGQVDHVPLPAGSPAAVDFCPTFADAAKQALGADVTPMPKGVFECWWVTAAHNVLTLTLTSGTWPPVTLPGQQQALQIAGRPAVTVQVPNPSLASANCTVQYGAAPFGDQTSDILTASVTVKGSGDVATQSQQFMTTVVNNLAAHH